MTSSQHWAYALGYTDATMASTMGSQPVRRSKSQKASPSSDCRLQFACMKPESLVNAFQHGALNTFSGLVHTARHVMGVGDIRTVIGFDRKMSSMTGMKA